MYRIWAYSASVKMCGVLHNTPTTPLSTVTAANWRFPPIHMLHTVARYDRSEGQYWAPNPNSCTVKHLYLGNSSETGHMYIYTFLLRMTNTVTPEYWYFLLGHPVCVCVCVCVWHLAFWTLHCPFSARVWGILSIVACGGCTEVAGMCDNIYQ